MLSSSAIYTDPETHYFQRHTPYPETHYTLLLTMSVCKVVFFYSPWSGACKRFKSTWLQLVATHKGKDFAFAKLDGYQHMELTRTHQIKTFPTVKFFPRELKASDASDKYNLDLAVQGGELFHGALNVADITKFLAASSFLQRFRKPPPPPPPEPQWHDWFTGGSLSTYGTETMTVNADGSMTMSETFTEGFG